MVIKAYQESDASASFEMWQPNSWSLICCVSPSLRIWWWSDGGGNDDDNDSRQQLINLLNT